MNVFFNCCIFNFAAQETALYVKEKESDLLGNTHEALIVSDILDQFRQFNLIEKHLQNPASFPDEYAFLITPKSIRLLIEKYYDFDDQVIREILGKKLSGRNRKDLSDVSEKTKIGLKSCRRQFDNVKRVYKTVEEMSGNLVYNIQTHFLLPEPLAKRYATVVYIANNRFETSKRKLQYLKFDDFLYCAYEMMSNWSCRTRECKYEEATIEICRVFLRDLREVKVLSEKEFLDELKHLFVRENRTKISERCMQDLDPIYKLIARNIINIAIGLNHSKEIRDFFLDIVEKVIEPCKQIKMNLNDLQIFIQSFVDIPLALEPCKSNAEIRSVWSTFVRTFVNCVIKMYH